jgi:6-phosphogluconolactonase
MENFFESREEASLAAATSIAASLTRRLAVQPSTSMVVTGGSSPGQCYTALAKADLEWDRVQLLLSDERWVPPTHADSNEKMLRAQLLVENAAHAELLPMYAPNTSVAERCDVLNDSIATLNIPFACALLGMGGDGHIASLFPDLQDLDAYLEVDSSTFFVPVETAASPHARISLTGSALTRSDEILLLFFGDDKRAVYERAKTSATEFPVSRLLFQKRAPVHVFWAP